MSKQEILKLLNHALELEHAATVQYLSHAECVDGEGAESIISRLKEIAGDEKDHAEKFRTLIGALGGVPSMGMAPTYAATTVKEILEVNLKGEKEAVDTYKKIIEKLKTEKIPYYDYLLEHDIRHILMEEQEHITEIELLLKTSGSSY
jgi:bacterioferritin (cytochrome b1)